MGFTFSEKSLSRSTTSEPLTHLEVAPLVRAMLSIWTVTASALVLHSRLHVPTMAVAPRGPVMVVPSAADALTSTLSAEHHTIPMFAALAKSDADKALDNILTSFPLYFTAFALVAAVVQLIASFVLKQMRSKD